ncbi:hypothetical protein KHQ06_15945 [Nocardia tengchongensis]|uniref:Uncharacterized protein n=1 Tax=Nocardia tengchongensis TaxID=2055889 RepID=A0ABX8CW44_9NOCA|nr:hypothetical protein [Nocardia tengchongensis]QVI24131.1 hypothetical protein KHQ06_15945 [Nocardia tengchongensis]
MSGNEVDELARSWPQLAALILQLLQRIQRASADGSIRLSRADYKQFVTELRDAQKTLTHEINTTQSWYQARTEEYQRESRAAGSRATAGASAEEQATGVAYLSGLRASIEHTIHDTVLTAEQRGQIVQTLDGIDNDPSKPVARNVFEPITGDAAVRARLTAAASEQRVHQHRERLTHAAATTTGQPTIAEIAQLRQENARRFDDLAGRLERLEGEISQLRPEQTPATAANGYGAFRETHKPRPRAGQRQEHHPEADQGHGTSMTPQAAAEAEQDSQAPRPAAEQTRSEAVWAEWAARMQAEA